MIFGTLVILDEDVRQPKLDFKFFGEKLNGDRKVETDTHGLSPILIVETVAKFVIRNKDNPGCIANCFSGKPYLETTTSDEVIS